VKQHGQTGLARCLALKPNLDAKLFHPAVLAKQSPAQPWKTPPPVPPVQSDRWATQAESPLMATQIPPLMATSNSPT